MGAVVKVMSGVCGMSAQIKAAAAEQYGVVALEITSDCRHIQKLAAELTEVNPFQEIGFRGEGPKTLRLAAQHCAHAACPVPSAIIKAVEVAAGLALPKDVQISIERE